MITLIDIYDCYSTVTDFSVLSFFSFFVRRRTAFVSPLSCRASFSAREEKERDLDKQSSLAAFGRD